MYYFAIYKNRRTFPCRKALHILYCYRPIIICRTFQLFSISSYFLSVHPSERDMQISHRMSTRGDWNEQLIQTVCHSMHRSAPKDAYFVEVGAYVGEFARGRREQTTSRKFTKF